MSETDPLDRLSRVANQSERPAPEFGERLLNDLLGDLTADGTTPTVSSVDHTTNNPTAEVIMLSPDRNQLPERSRTGLLIAASVAAIALIGGLLVVANRDDVQPADQPVPTVSETLPENVTVPPRPGVDESGVPATYPAGVGPAGMAFDGTSLWIANATDQTVSKMNPADGTRVDYPTGTDTREVLSDGTSIWITNYGDGTVSKFDPADGTRVDYETGRNPSGLAFDGTSIWITNVNDDTVSKMDRSDGTRVDYPVGSAPRSATFDGTNIWVANDRDSTVSKIDPTDGTRVDYDTGTQPQSVVFDGTSIWTANINASTLSKIDPADGTRVDFEVGGAESDDSFFLAFDGTSVWAINSGPALENTVSRIDPADGTRANFPTGAGPEGITFVGSDVWVTNFGDDTVSRIVPGSSGDIEPDPGLINPTSIFDGDTCTYNGPAEFVAGSEVTFTLVDNSATRSVGFSVWEVAEQTTADEILDEGIFRTNGEQIPESAPAVVTDTGIQVTYLLDRPGFYALNCADRPDGGIPADHATLFTVVG